jgi:hypothetical protein
MYLFVNLSSSAFVHIFYIIKIICVYSYILSHVWCDYRQGFGLEIGFTDHLQVVTTSKYNTTVKFHTLKITTAHAKSFQSAVTSRFPATDLHKQRLFSFHSQLHQLSLLFRLPYNSLPSLQLTSKFVPLISPWYGPRRKHCLLLYSIRSHRNMFVCKGVTQ